MNMFFLFFGMVLLRDRLVTQSDPAKDAVSVTIVLCPDTILSDGIGWVKGTDNSKWKILWVDT